MRRRNITAPLYGGPSSDIRQADRWMARPSKPSGFATQRRSLCGPATGINPGMCAGATLVIVIRGRCPRPAALQEHAQPIFTAVPFLLDFSKSHPPHTATAAETLSSNACRLAAVENGDFDHSLSTFSRPHNLSSSSTILLICRAISTSPAK